MDSLKRVFLARAARIVEVAGIMAIAALLAFFVTITVGIRNARAEIWQTAATLRKGSVSVGGFGQLYIDPANFMLTGNVAYGLSPGLQAEARLGLGTIDPYLGAFAKYFIASTQALDFAVWGGIHTVGSVPYLDAALLLSHEFKTFDVYAHPLLQIPLKSGYSTSLALVPGFAIPIRRQVTLYGEAVLSVSKSFNALSFGARYFF